MVQVVLFKYVQLQQLDREQYGPSHIVYLPGASAARRLRSKRTDVCPKGLRFKLVIFFIDSRALRGSLYVVGGGASDFMVENL